MSRLIRLQRSLLLAVLVSISCFGAGSRNYSDGLVAVVNEEPITVYDVAVFTSRAEAEVLQSMRGKDLEDPKVNEELVARINEIRKQAAHELIDQKLIFTEFENKGYQVPNELVEKRIDEMVASQAGGDWGKWDDLLEERSITAADFRESVERRTAVQLLLNQEVDRHIAVTPARIEAFYRDNLTRYTSATSVRLHLLMVKAGASPARKARVALVRQALETQPFADAARRYSDGPKRDEGGDYGWMDEKDLRKAFRDALPALARGATSGPITIGEDVWFAHLSDVKPGVVQSLDDVRTEIRGRLYAQERNRLLDEYVAKLRDKASIRIFFKE